MMVGERRERNRKGNIGTGRGQVRFMGWEQKACEEELFIPKTEDV